MVGREYGWCTLVGTLGTVIYTETSGNRHCDQRSQEIYNTRNYEERLHHVNVGAIQLLDNAGLVRWLERLKPFELVGVM